MSYSIKKISTTEELHDDWDKLAHCYYLKREFLAHLQVNNYCNQSYYQLLNDGKLLAGTIVYTVKTNLLTFLNVPTPVSFRVIGLPVSIASEPFVGERNFLDPLIKEILVQEKGLILGLNFTHFHLPGKVVSMRTLPTMVLRLKAEDMPAYQRSLRHPYRRRLKRIAGKFKDVEQVTTSCSEFNETHYRLYLDVMKTSTTKLETLGVDAFRFLPEKFRLTTFYAGNEMLFWHILLPDVNRLYYFMCGINYKIRGQYEAYHNSLFSIIRTAMQTGYQIVDLGQTAEVAKVRVGAVPDERLMFMYHKNPLLFFIIRLCRNLIAYSSKPPVALVFKTEGQCIKEHGTEEHDLLRDKMQHQYTN